MFSLICTRIDCWVNNREAGDLWRRRAHYDVILMKVPKQNCGADIAYHHWKWLLYVCCHKHNPVIYLMRYMFIQELNICNANHRVSGALAIYLLYGYYKHLPTHYKISYVYTSFISRLCTVYPKKYAHVFCFAVLCCGYTLTDFPISIRLTSLASNDCPSASKATLMNMDKYFMWIHYERLHNHNEAKHNKTVCIFLGIYCISLQNYGLHWFHMGRHFNKGISIWFFVTQVIMICDSICSMFLAEICMVKLKYPCYL